MSVFAQSPHICEAEIRICTNNTTLTYTYIKHNKDVVCFYTCCPPLGCWPPTTHRLPIKSFVRRSNCCPRVRLNIAPHKTSKFFGLNICAAMREKTRKKKTILILHILLYIYEYIVWLRSNKSFLVYYAFSRRCHRHTYNILLILNAANRLVAFRDICTRR